MAVYTYADSTEHNIYPDLKVYDRFRDGVHVGWKIEAKPGYVLRDTDTELNEDGDEITVTRYSTPFYLPSNFDWPNFALVAVPRDSEEVKS